MRKRIFHNFTIREAYIDGLTVAQQGGTTKQCPFRVGNRGYSGGWRIAWMTGFEDGRKGLTLKLLPSMTAKIPT